MNKKYEFTGEEKSFYGRNLKRIKAKISFENVCQGEVGGWIEKEENLSENGNSWVSGNACVFENAQVYEDAIVYENAIVSGNSRVCGEANVFGDAYLAENAYVSGNTLICGFSALYGNARIEKNTDIITFGNIGSNSNTLTAYKTDKGFSVNVGLFNGDLDVLIEQVQLSEHEDHQFLKEYRLISEVIKARFEEGK